MVLFEHNNTIYIKDNMIYYLAKPFQYEDNDVRVNLRPKVYDKNNNNKQSTNLQDGTSIPIEYYGVLPWIAARKPTKYQVESCEKIALTSKFDWDPYEKGGIFSKVEAHSFEGTDPISDDLSCLSLGAMILDTPVLYQSNNTAKNKRGDEDMYCTVGAVKAKYSP